MRTRLRDNRMPPNIPFDITEANRDGPLVLHGERLVQHHDETDLFGTGECEVHAVPLMGAWIQAGAPESASFDFASEHGETCSGVFATDILPLFTENSVWHPGAEACSSCHFSNGENSYHEMDLSSYAGIMKGGDVLSKPPGVPLFGQSKVGATDFDWAHSKMRKRLRDNRMPPGMPFDITEGNRDGPEVDVNGNKVTAVDLLGAWVEAGVPEHEPFGEYKAEFYRHVLPLFTEHGIWHPATQACSSCHFSNGEHSYHELDLTSYEGLMKGGDVLSKPPGVPMFGQSKVGATDYDWAHSKMRARLRNNRMPPSMPFEITEENRDGPDVLAGKRK